MTAILHSIGHESLPSVLNDPFKATCITRISVWFSSGWGRYGANDWKATGTVEFRNNQTKGEQQFEAQTFDEVVLKIKAFIKELESK